MKYSFNDGKIYSNVAEEILENPMIEHGYLGIITGGHYIGSVVNLFMFIAKYTAATHFVITEEQDIIDSIMALYPVSQLIKVEP